MMNRATVCTRKHCSEEADTGKAGYTFTVYSKNINNCVLKQASIIITAGSCIDNQ